MAEAVVALPTRDPASVPGTGPGLSLAVDGLPTEATAVASTSAARMLPVSWLVALAAPVESGR